MNKLKKKLSNVQDAVLQASWSNKVILRNTKYYRPTSLIASDCRTPTVTRCLGGTMCVMDSPGPLAVRMSLCWHGTLWQITGQPPRQRDTVKTLCLRCRLGLCRAQSADV